MNSFFALHSFLEVGKTQDLSSKFWQTLGDALSNSNSFANELGIHIILAKQRKIDLQQFGKPTWQK
jgi:hypothetical protein